MSRPDRKEILKAVYEDNRRIDDRSFSQEGPGRPGPWKGALIAILVVAGLLMAGRWGAGLVTGDDVQRAELGVPVDSLVADSTPVATDFSGLAQAEVPLTALFDLGVKRIVVDAGHGGFDPGALGQSGLQEKEVTLDVAQRLARRLEDNHGLTVLMTRDDDTFLSLRERVEFSNANEADLFISIHVNSIPVERVHAIETYYFGAEPDEDALRLAELENQNSDYTLAEFNNMLDAIGDQVKIEESRQLARAIQQSMVRNTRRLNEDVANWGIKSAPFVVLVGTEAPGILAEIGVISNGDAESRLATSEYREQLALFMEEGVVNYLRTLHASPAPTGK